MSTEIDIVVGLNMARGLQIPLVPGSELRMANCGDRVFLAPVGQAFLASNPGAYLMCDNCQDVLAPGAKLGLMPGQETELMELLGAWSTRVLTEWAQAHGLEET